MGAPGQVFGTPGGSLARATWAVNDQVAAAGRKGEQLTATYLDALAALPDGPSVLHDLDLPGTNANIDHVVVAGRTVTIVDSKLWRPGLYVTIAGRTFRGLHRVAHVDKPTMVLARRDLTRVLATAPGRPRFTVARPVLVVWPSNGGSRLRTFALRVPGARVWRGEPFARRGARSLGQSSADPLVLAALLPLVRGLGATTAPPAAPEPQPGPASDPWDDIGALG